MAEPTELTRHVEAYIDTSRSPAQQAAALEAIASLLKSGRLTIEAMVREMGLYLTTTDAIIRAKGILLLAEVLSCLSSNPLDKITIHSLITFFTERLADWKALRGALVGCLALMRRNDQVGRVTLDDAKAVLESFLESLHVQSLGQHDRKLCFELLECLLENYSDAVIPLGNQVIDGLCESIDMEKDPECLMLAFHIVKLAAQLFPDPDGPLACVAEELFEILGHYFPIHFTHQKAEDLNITRDNLSSSLMLAFSSTPLFEPFAVPLLLEKLSSDLPSAKVDALKYLNHCSLKYGPERMAKHAEAIWRLLKDTILLSLRELILSFSPESLDTLETPRNEIADGALTFLETAVAQNNDLFLNLILGDADVNLIIQSISSYKSYTEISSEMKERVHAVGRILAVSAKTSIASCNRVFGSIRPCLLEALGISVRDLYGNHPHGHEHVDSEEISFGALFLSVLLLEASRDLIVGSEKATFLPNSGPEASHSIFQGFATGFERAFISTMSRNNYTEVSNPHVFLGVKGLQIFATFPGGLLPIQGSLFEDILTMLVSVVTQNCKNEWLWTLAMKALVNIGSYIFKYHQPEKGPSFMAIVVEKISSLLTSTELGMPYPLKLEAASNVGMIEMNYMLRIVRGVEEALFTNLSEIYTQVNIKSAEETVQLLHCYSTKILPWMQESGGTEQVPMQFVAALLSQIEGCNDLSSVAEEKGIMDATMEAVKFAVGSCSEASQNIIVEKTCSILSSSSYFSVDEYSFPTLPIEMEGLLSTNELESMPAKEKWVLSLFASVIIALHPTTHISNVRAAIHLFMRTFLKGHIPSAQALGSIVNKLCPRQNGERVPSDCSLEEAIDLIFNLSMRYPGKSKITLSDICHAASTNKSLQISALVGLAWIGKGLLMRGHDKVKDITMIFLECFLPTDGMSSKQASPEEEQDQNLHSSVMKYAADSFRILMSDSEDCLNRRFHPIIRPLYKQRFFSIMLPIFQSLFVKCDSSLTRSLLYRAFAHVVCEAPLIAVLGEAKKLIPLLVDAILIFSKDDAGKDLMYSLLLVLSGILMDKNGQDAVIDNASMIINCLISSITYPHMMPVRETGLQCLFAMSTLPHTRVYPLRTQVLQAIARVLDDPKRVVRLEAVRCRQAWSFLC
ncbi:MMS19 nucleotide excision repair protein homolog isoform X1 [Punica granatum]|uniref:MMS19 nucleotide excision repair protein n=3 Tax=Punica granatum TaxID=22663 RepID=A0A6P8CZ04_PUNGR|nr:MMS19 nucleotide excision repair protein homolog isoform X1 [Punica granatum]